MSDRFYEHAERFIRWIERRVVQEARGDTLDTMKGRPDGRFWLGRVASEIKAQEMAASERILRLDPCAVGFTFQPSTATPWDWTLEISFRVWRAEGKKELREWRKSESVEASICLDIATTQSKAYVFGANEIRTALGDIGDTAHGARVEVEVVDGKEWPTVTITLVNDTPESKNGDDNLYEVTMKARVGRIEPFILDSIADSFRYDRLLAAYGVNGGVRYENETLETEDFVSAEKARPTYWDNAFGDEADLTFETLHSNPVPALSTFLERFESWVDAEWSPQRINQRAHLESWSPEMLTGARAQASEAAKEVARCREGLACLDDSKALFAFKAMNRAFAHSGAGKYDRWRPFQVGFMLTALPGIVGASEAELLNVDTLWFATGGGKTETYLAAIVFGALYDRINRKDCGITAWSRFPLRMLSLQQTQRFADALAGAELARREAGISGTPISLGYFVGNNGTPNKVRFDPKPYEADAADPAMPSRYRVLLHCPFCLGRDIHMNFDEATWRLIHECINPDCPWPDKALPFYVVDEEIYRFLPTVVVGTLDKAASVALQAAMRGFYAAPSGVCSGPSHGFTYSPRSKSPTGCQVPDCQYPRDALTQDKSIFSPRIRVQDELHLLADSLGAIDSHYETLLDHLTEATGGTKSKVLASSATLHGFETQVKILYDRDGTAFPVPGPKEGHSFWSVATDRTMRRYLALAPRGQTQEFANERVAQSVQQAIRDFARDPSVVCSECDIDPSYADDFISIYGVHVVYGSRLRDIEGAARSFESQPPVDPTNLVVLFGSTPLNEVLQVIKRLDSPEENLDDRIHIVCASSMMSHGVDIDRLNVMTMMGMPLSAAEFIQTSARIGRRYPGLVFVLHRMAVERDAKIFRSFSMFVRHGDRLVEPIAVTRNSRRVLARTAPGVLMSDVLGVYEPAWISAGGKPMTMANIFRQFVRRQQSFETDEVQSMYEALRIDTNGESPMAVAVRDFIHSVMNEINDPASSARFTSDLLPDRVLISLRDVEDRVPIREVLN
jgi:hypothetical protein